jgi:FkbM family methyltransferase
LPTENLWDQANQFEQRFQKWSYKEIERQVSIYRNHVDDFENKMDFPSFEFLAEKAKAHMKNIVVVGVNRGQSIEALLERVPDAHIHGFEITKVNVNIARENFKDNPNVVIHHAGVGEKPGKSFVATSNDEQIEGSGLFEPVGRWGGLKKTDYEVDVVTLSMFHDSLSVGPFDYIIVDTEGHEPNVIQGMN